MFKYVIQLANTANSLPNLDFDNRYVGSANFQGIFGICMTHKSLLSIGAWDLYTWHILNLYFKFLLCANLMTNLEFPNEFAAIAYEFLYFNITIALRIHLRDVQIWRRLPWYVPPVPRKDQYICSLLLVCKSGLKFQQTNIYLTTLKNAFQNTNWSE